MNKITSIKNFWSLNVDEAFVTGILRSNTSKNVEVFMPLNAQMKGIDLLLINTKSKNNVTVQVKGSRAHKRIKKDGWRSQCWFTLKKKDIDNPIADYFIFLLNVIESLDKTNTGRMNLEQHLIIIPSEKLKKKFKNKKASKKDEYQFYIWPETKDKKLQVYDDRDLRSSDREYYTEFLDENGFKKLNNDLK